MTFGICNAIKFPSSKLIFFFIRHWISIRKSRITRRNLYNNSNNDNNEESTQRITIPQNPIRVLQYLIKKPQKNPQRGTIISNQSLGDSNEFPKSLRELQNISR